MIVFLDTGVVGLVSSPKKSGEAQDCKQWLYSLLAKGIYVVSSDICDYEVRRGLLLASVANPAVQGINNLDTLQRIIDFLPLTKNMMRKAAQLWAEAQTQGLPNAARENIDADIIIAAQCQLLEQEYPGQYFVVATTNVKHLKRFTEAREWSEIDF